MLKAKDFVVKKGHGKRGEPSYFISPEKLTFLPNFSLGIYVWEDLCLHSSMRDKRTGELHYFFTLKEANEVLRAFQERWGDVEIGHPIKIEKFGNKWFASRKKSKLSYQYLHKNLTLQNSMVDERGIFHYFESKEAAKIVARKFLEKEREEGMCGKKGFDGSATMKMQGVSLENEALQARASNVIPPTQPTRLPILVVERKESVPIHFTVSTTPHGRVYLEANGYILARLQIKDGKIAMYRIGGLPLDIFHTEGDGKIAH